MKQLELLTIRQQPLQREPHIPSRVIKNYVRENLRGFLRRQRERERIRREQQERYARPRPRKPRIQPTMQTIRVTYRAVFAGPTGALNPLGMRVPGKFPVELFQSRGQWQAREIQTPRRQVYEKLGKFVSRDHAQRGIESSFERRLTEWQVWGIPPNRDKIEPERLLLPHEICDLGNGQMGWYEPKDLTHIIHAPSIPPGAKIPPAACGAKVDAKCFINNRANVRPTCPACAEVWEREYRDR